MNVDTTPQYFNSKMTTNKSSTLWMGDLEPYMDETFIKQSFNTMGENVVYVKVMRNRQPFGYGFVEFESEEVALRVLHRVNGKIVPGSSPPKRYKLNHANHGNPLNKEFSLFVGDLTPDVDDLGLYKAFSSWYPSCRVARVVLDANGRSRGYGFVRFADEYEQQQALIHMQNYSGVGGKPIRVSLATPKSKAQTATSPSQTTAPTVDYTQYFQQGYEQYQNYYQNWSDYTQYYGYNYATYAQPDQQVQPGQTPEVPYEAPENNLEEHDVPLDIDQENILFAEDSEEVFDAIEASRWLPHEMYEFETAEG
ncbi:tRNA selenocysteine 1-associated protein 1 [Chamberlinius hualienensis]